VDEGEANPRFIVTSLIDADGDYLCFGSSHACRRRYQLSRAGLADTAAVGLRTLVCGGRGAPALSRTPREIEPHTRYRCIRHQASAEDTVQASPRPFSRPKRQPTK